MSWSWFLILLLGTPVAILIAVAAVKGMEWLGIEAENLSSRCESHFSGWRDRATHQRLYEQDRMAFLRWLAAKLGTDRMTGAVDETLVEAQRQTEVIHPLVEGEVPRAVAQCVETHRLMAQITGASHMGAIQYEPELMALRSRTVWLLSHTVDLLNHYPLKFDDPRLLYNSILLRKRALPICRACPYIRCAVHELPKLCPTAQLFQVGEVQHAQF